MIRGVIFDLDGVLVTTDELHYRAWKQIADEEDIDFDREINHRLRGVSRMQSLDIILERCTRKPSAAEKQSMADRKNELYRRSLESLGPQDVLPGAREILGELRRRGIKLAVASSSRNARTILERTALASELDAVVDGNDITRSKPHPEVFLLAAERLGLPPVECLVVEDAMAGIEAAARANMPAFGIGDAQTLPGVGHVAGTLAEIAAEGLLAAAEK